MAPPCQANCDGKHYQRPEKRGKTGSVHENEAFYEKAPGLASIRFHRPRGAGDSVGEVIRIVEGQEVEKEQLLIREVVGEDVGFKESLSKEIFEEGFGCRHRITDTVAGPDAGTLSVALPAGLTAEDRSLAPQPGGRASSVR